MRNTARLCLATMLAAMSLGAWSADTGIKPTATGRLERAERQFGDVRFVLGAGAAMQWLEMYVDGNMIGVFRHFEADDVTASPDGKYFLAISNRASSSLAFAVFDRQGHLVFSSAHSMDSSNHDVQGLRYCAPSAAGNRYWIDAANPRASFELARSSASAAAQEYLKSVTVRGCDGEAVLLGQAEDPALRLAAEQAAREAKSAACEASKVENQSSSYLFGATIACLRGMDPNFGNNTLTLTNGPRTVVPPALQAEPAEAPDRK